MHENPPIKIQKIYGKKREKKESPPKKNESRLQVSRNGREAKMPWAELGPASQPGPFLQNSTWGEVRIAKKTHLCKIMTEVQRSHTHNCKTILGRATSIVQREAHSCTTIVGMNQEAAQSLGVMAFSCAPFGPDLGQGGLCGRKKEDKFKH